MGETVKLTAANSPFARRLARCYEIDDADLDELADLEHSVASFKPGEQILERGSEMKQLLFLASGWVVRCRYTPEGMRQIVHILVPGDIVTPGVFVTRHADHGITALTDCVVRFVEPREMQSLFAATRTLAAAFWWAAEQEHGILREQIVRLGRRSAMHRIPHLFLELHRRLLIVDEATADTFELPLTQNDIADALGLSNVHVNRTLKKLVAGDYIDYRGHLIRIADSQKLAELCDFDTSHLHLDSTVEHARTTGVA